MTNQTLSKPWLGCIADDFTGASDLASFLVSSGLKTMQINGLPDEKQLAQIDNVDAVVIALKSRTIEVGQAVKLSLTSLEVLQSLGCQKFYFKYCSTFDSTPVGNIGPVVDALMERLQVQSTIVCPALPINGRTVYKGHLFVFDQLLSDSPMKDHPLTPMHDSSLLKMMETQGNGKAGLLSTQTLDEGIEATQTRVSKLQQQYQYIVADALHERHLKTIGASLANFKLITGGSGLAIGLGQEFEAQGGVLSDAKNAIHAIKAPTLLLSGSCSAMTQKQVAAYGIDHPVLNININKLVKGEQDVDAIFTWLEKVIDKAPLVTATATPEDVVLNQQEFGAEYLAELIEQTFANLALAAKQKLGVRNFVVAGGETSGAIVSALNAECFYIGKTIAPGVPMLQTPGQQPFNLALKSGNFGQEDFFNKAVETLSCC